MDFFIVFTLLLLVYFYWLLEWFLIWMQLFGYSRFCRSVTNRTIMILRVMNFTNKYQASHIWSYYWYTHVFIALDLIFPPCIQVGNLETWLLSSNEVGTYILVIEPWEMLLIHCYAIVDGDWYECSWKMWEWWLLINEDNFMTSRLKTCIQYTTEWNGWRAPWG